jgi:hypothetical protein
VHTLGFGSGRAGAGLSWIVDFCGGVADIQALEQSVVLSMPRPRVRGFNEPSAALCDTGGGLPLGWRNE